LTLLFPACLLQGRAVRPFFPAVQPSISPFYCKLLDNLIKACYSLPCLSKPIPARQVVLLTAPKSSHPKPLPSRQPFVPINPLAATLMDVPASVANKRLTFWPNPLDATLTKNKGRGLSASGSLQLPSLLATTLKFFPFIFLRTLLHSRKSQLFYFQALPHSLPKITRGGGTPRLVFLTSLPPI
jgi:hypothetical protein